MNLLFLEMTFKRVKLLIYLYIFVLLAALPAQVWGSEGSLVETNQPQETVTPLEEQPSDGSAALPPQETAVTAPEERKIVKSIEVVGNKTIGLSVILAKVKTRVGQEYIQTVISDDLKRLYNTGYFSDARVDRQEYEQGFKVIFYLIEKPIVEEITFSKLRYFNTKVLLKKIKTQAGQFLDSKFLKDDIETIKDLYAQKGLTQAEIEAETKIDEATSKAKLHFVIKEGYQGKIRKIYVQGNETFPDKRILKIIKSRAKALFNSGYLKEDILKEDMERITSFYEQQGFIDAQAQYRVEYKEKGRMEVYIDIEEGRKYFVGNIILTGNQVIPQEEILGVMQEVKEGGIFSREKLSVDISKITTLYYDKGYIFVNVTEATSLNSETGQVDIKLNIEEGSIAYLDKIKIQGNTRTRDIVIRRELKLYPDDRFDGDKLRRSREKLENLGYFEEINFDIEDTKINDRKDLVVQVKEAKTGTLSFGGGFSTIDKLVGFIEIEQRNFDFTNWPAFTGGGQHLELRFETGSTRNNLQFSFTEPWLFDHPVSAGFDVYRTQVDRESDVGYAFDEKRVGGDIRLGKQLTDYVTGDVLYKNERVTIENFAEGVSADVLAEEGTNLVSLFGFSLTRDTRDSIYSTTKGVVLSGGVDVAGGLLGGDKDFYRTQIKGSRYFPFKFKSVLETRLRLGVVESYGDSENVPIFERFFAGGARSVRGYDERRVGPIDPNTEDPIGGESMIVGNIEYTIPLIEFIKFATFFDVGNVWAEADDFGTGDYKSGTGIGLRVKTPIGPVNLDYGYPLSDEPGEEEKSGKFYFSVSRGF